MSGTGATERAVEGTELVLRQEPTGERLLLERAPAVPAADVPALLAAADRFGRLTSPHLLRPDRVLADAQQTVVVLDGGPVRSLAALLAARGHLDAGEVVTVGVALARALTAAHADDLLLGGLSTAQVLLRDDGMPVVAVGVQALRASVEEDLVGGRAHDVGALAAVCRALLGPAPPPALVEVLERAAALDLPERPDAVVLGALLARACPPAPVRLPAGPAREPVDRGGGPGLPSRVLLVLAVLVAAAGVVGWVSAAEDEPVPPAQAPRWSVVLDRLDEARAAAFAAADEAALGGVYTPSARPLAEDRARVRALAAAGRTAHPVRHRLRDVEVVRARPDRVRLRITDVLAPYTVRDREGAVVVTAAGRDERVSVVDLFRTAAGWRIVEVARPP